MAGALSYFYARSICIRNTLLLGGICAPPPRSGFYPLTMAQLRPPTYFNHASRLYPIFLINFSLLGQQGSSRFSLCLNGQVEKGIRSRKCVSELTVVVAGNSGGFTLSALGTGVPYLS